MGGGLGITPGESDHSKGLNWMTLGSTMSPGLSPGFLFRLAQFVSMMWASLIERRI